jgi:hypothetical protein
MHWPCSTSLAASPERAKVALPVVLAVWRIVAAVVRSLSVQAQPVTAEGKPSTPLVEGVPLSVSRNAPVVDPVTVGAVAENPLVIVGACPATSSLLLVSRELEGLTELEVIEPFDPVRTMLSEPDALSRSVPLPPPGVCSCQESVAPTSEYPVSASAFSSPSYSRRCRKWGGGRSVTD